MEWDAGAIMRLGIALFFVLVGIGLTYALFRLANVLRELTTMLHDVNQEVVPILTRVQTTVDEVNSELGKVDEITGSVVKMASTIETTAASVQSAIGAPVKKVAGLSAGLTEAVSSFVSQRRKEA